ncbi:hypothetical protein TREMEDRAFT_63725 [Tremella mesenterica DSM 1558]|uniref:uncharacterized protein n=1 Tax=Tremella mesenterica (strain ATCC 24925 / CBS 8224 / DSM 1558 / NBRC 9311 / NRRL Y-6157 / RJB 2259-6 / UBC 559-6) TaxID=578456 RepID=UPI0003F49880|nr:uncharacterized protein TREMEDRAFT_63725 [Tremella mesenterica DSM 1558]EIW67833.1 hypothetical protein TREMEDRAFT_63725 [Tremella mesenterica DSM 1558]
MPLPVERSQGSVSALVARFQTAADRDRDAQAREASKGPRSSGSFSRRSSSFGFAPSIDSLSPAPTGSGMSPDLHGGVAGIKDEAMEMEILKDPQELSGGKKINEGDEKVAEITNITPSHEPSQKEHVDNAPPTLSQSINQTKSIKPSSNVKDSPRKPSSPIATKTTTGGVVHKPIVGSNTTQKNQPSIITKSPQRNTTTTAAVSPTSPTNQIKKSNPISPSQPAKSPTTTSRVVSRPKNFSSSTTTPHPGISSTPKDSPIKPPSISSVRQPKIPQTSRLVPNMTGPRHRSPSASTVGGITSPPPLRPHLTGTPSKPTASFLAKQRPAHSSEEKRKSTPSNTMSLGRNAGSRISSASRPAPRKSIEQDVKISQPTSPTTSKQSTTGSRLLQGTAASRARAANVSPKTDKSTNSPSNKVTSLRNVSNSMSSGKTPSKSPTSPTTKINGNSNASATALSSKKSLGKVPSDIQKTPAVGRSPIGRLGLAAAREKAVRPEQTPPVGNSPIGRIGLAGAREKAKPVEEERDEEGEAVQVEEGGSKQETNGEVAEAQEISGETSDVRKDEEGEEKEQEPGSEKGNPAVGNEVTGKGDNEQGNDIMKNEPQDAAESLPLNDLKIDDSHGVISPIVNDTTQEEHVDPATEDIPDIPDSA